MPPKTRGGLTDEKERGQPRGRPRGRPRGSRSRGNIQSPQQIQEVTANAVNDIVQAVPEAARNNVDLPPQFKNDLYTVVEAAVGAAIAGAFRGRGHYNVGHRGGNHRDIGQRGRGYRGVGYRGRGYRGGGYRGGGYYGGGYRRGQRGDGHHRPDYGGVNHRGGGHGGSVASSWGSGACRRDN